MRFKGMDLNLFAAFEALMETRSTARAGDLMGVSQPAASAALARLREYFGDQLLVVQGRRMFPTPFAESLLPQVRACLRSAEAALTTSRQFSAENASRDFRIVASDYVVAAVLAPLCRDIASWAPGLRFQFVLTDENSVEKLRRGQVDLLIGPSEYALPDMPTAPLYDEEFVIAGCLNHPIFAEGVTVDGIFACGHVAVAVGSERAATVGDRQLALMGYQRTVEVVASSFTVLPWLLMGTRRLALMHGRLARLTAKHFDIGWAPLPMKFSPLHQLVQYHPTRARDPGVTWLIDQIRAFANSAGA
jgi:DNA-binding transcriptional LysR family regulator